MPYYALAYGLSSPISSGRSVTAAPTLSFTVLSADGHSCVGKGTAAVSRLSRGTRPKSALFRLPSRPESCSFTFGNMAVAIAQLTVRVPTDAVKY